MIRPIYRFFKKILNFIKEKEDFLFIKHPVVYFFQYVFLIVIGGFIILFVFFGIVLFFNTDKFLYHPNNDDFFDCRGFNDYVKQEFNSTRFYYKENNLSDSVIVYYHGNRGTACDREYLTDFYDKINSSIIFVEYSGFARDDVKPSKKLLLNDAKNVQDFIDLKNISEVYLVGESLGTAISSYHSSLSENVETLVLIAPFDSVENVAKNSYLKYYPDAIYDYDNYDNIDFLRGFSGKVVIIHGTYDRNIPIERARNLFENLDTYEKYFFEIYGSTHNSLYNFKDTFNAIEFALKR